MGRPVLTTWTRLYRREPLRMAVLSGLSLALGLTFLALLIADEARAVSF
jgi:hypothetical protein